jgi:hypothetical protein
VIFPDGLGIYAIRTTSRHSVRNILGTIAYTAQFTHGRIAGLPFTLKIVHRPNVTGPDGTQRQIPVWAITTQPPSGVRLSSRTFRSVATQALREGQQLMLPAGHAPTLEEAEMDGPIEVGDSQRRADARPGGGGGPTRALDQTWHVMARGIVWSHDGKRYALDETAARVHLDYPAIGPQLSAFADLNGSRPPGDRRAGAVKVRPTPSATTRSSPERRPARRASSRPVGRSPVETPQRRRGRRSHVLGWAWTDQ